jgi:hypothetical protein
MHTPLKAFLRAMAWNEKQTIEYVPGAHFDGGTKP